MVLVINQEAILIELKELTKYTGNSMEAEVAAAVHERLERIICAKEELIARMMKLTDETAARWPRDPSEKNRTCSLHDDKNGLPA